MTRIILPLAALLLAVPWAAQAEVTIDWVTVGDPGNDCDTQQDGCFGAVDYEYRISKFEVTNTQYAEFLNAVAATDTYGLYNANMDTLGGFGGITQMGSPGSYSYSAKTGRENVPVNYVSFWDATRFANWLHNGQPTGAQDNTTTEDGAYTLTPTGIANNTVTRNASVAEYFVPSEDEWYKAAYYKPASLIYSEDFEANDGWFKSSTPFDEWKWGSPTVWPSRCASGQSCWCTNLDGNYGNDGNNTLASPAIDLSEHPPGTALDLSWWQAVHIEPFPFDQAYAEVSINGGSWQVMWQNVGTITPQDWREQPAAPHDISAAAGGFVEFRFRMVTDFSVTYPGWCIDDIFIGVTGIYFDYPAGADTPTTCTQPGATENTANCESAALGGDLAEVGSYTAAAGPHGTFDQGGNVWEWNETIVRGSLRGERGGSFISNTPLDLAASHRSDASPSFESRALGFRVASLPEPGAAVLQLAALLSLLSYRRLRGLNAAP